MTAPTLDYQSIAIEQDHALSQALSLSRFSGFEGASIEDGYAVQVKMIERNRARGHHLNGWKVAMANQAALTRFSLETPVYAPLFDFMQLSNQLVPAAQTIAPKLEAEVVFILGRDIVDASSSRDEILASIAYVVPAFEVADSRTAWTFDIPTFLADGAVARFYRIGRLLRFDPDYDFETLSCSLHTESSCVVGSSFNLIGGPLETMITMVRDLVPRFGPLRAGQHFLSGSLTPPLDMKLNSRYRLELLGQTLELEYR
ncbi:2-keto-4-pentenoate hydratase [Nitrincola alkalisediminis]|uniref:2-keto-4-pentenoate hydratase n=1 Tax=Nitrincola alkalisediminis TaxID=1366656 RepID=UPI0018751AFB|nr:hypothetical protein [Nitrincola alkalisediminis]